VITAGENRRKISALGHAPLAASTERSSGETPKDDLCGDFDVERASVFVPSGVFAAGSLG
jgi:hypothetical protein